MVTPEIINPSNKLNGNNERYSEIILAIIDSVKATSTQQVGKNLVEVWKVCLEVLNKMQLGLDVGESAILAMDAAKKIWKQDSNLK